MWSRVPSIQSLKLLDAVVLHRSMTRAAADAGISQSAVSQSIRQLEDFVQAPLLDRSTRPMTLTPAGEDFHRVCIESLGRLAHTVETMRRTEKGNKNTVTVSCNLGFATYWLMPRLHDFTSNHPEIEVHVMVAYQGAAGLHDGSDVAIRYGSGRWADGPWETLFPETLIPICSPRYLEENGQILNIADLATRRLIHVAVSEPDWLGWSQYFGLINELDVQITGGLRFGNYVQAVQSTLAGEGVMLGWRSVVHDLLSAQQLAIAFNAPAHLSDGYFVRRSSSHEGSGNIDRLFDWLLYQANETLDFRTSA